MIYALILQGKKSKLIPNINQQRIKGNNGNFN